MAPVALNVAPGLRAWRQAGITHLLLDEPVAESVRAAARASLRAGTGQGAPRGTSERGGPAPSPPSGLGGEMGGGPVPHAMSRPALHREADASVGRDISAGQARNAVSRNDGQAPSFVESAAQRPRNESRSEDVPESWSENWQSLWAQMSASGSRPAAVWTYAELGTDLRGQADPTRRLALQSLIADLRLPRGSHAFWPYSLPPDNAPEPGMFLAGLARFRPGLVMLIGDQAVADLAPLGPLPGVSLQLAACRGFRFIRLMNLAELGELTGSRREQLIAFIRAAVM